MKKWENADLVALKVRATAYSEDGGNKQDGWYKSYDGKIIDPTYGPSEGNSGDPTIVYTNGSNEPQ